MTTVATRTNARGRHGPFLDHAVLFRDPDKGLKPPVHGRRGWPTSEVRDGSRIGGFTRWCQVCQEWVNVIGGAVNCSKCTTLIVFSEETR